MYLKKLKSSLFSVRPSHSIRNTGKLIFKIGFLICFSILLVSCSSPEAPMPTLDDAENALLITITTPLYTLSKDNDGFDIIQIDEYSLSGAPGDPALPIRVFSIALPPDVSLESVIVKVVDFKLETLDGSFKIKQAVADQTSGDDSSSGKEEITGEDIIQQLPPGQMRKWQFTKVEYSPFHYDDETGTLSVVSEVQLKISYDLSSAELDEALLADTAMDDIAEETFLNFDAAKDWYKLEE